MSAAKKNSLEQGISPISQEEFIRDFLPLPILHRGILFVLRTGYLIKQSPLEDLDVLGLCPTHTAEEEGALHVVLRRFFNRDASFWRSAAYDAIIQEELETKAHHKLLSEQRSIKSKRAAEARWKENGAPSNAPSIKNDAPSNAPSIKNDAPSNAPSINNDAPSINNDAPSNAPSIKSDATSNAPGIKNDATSNAPSIKSDATSNAPGIKSDATSNAPGIKNDAPSNAPSIKNDATSNAPGIKSDATSNAPSINNDATSNAPSINNDATSNAPGIKNDAPSNAPSIKNDAPSNAPSIANYAQKTLNPLGHRVFQEKADMIENPGNVQQEEPRARTRAHRSDRFAVVRLF